MVAVVTEAKKDEEVAEEFQTMTRGRHGESEETQRKWEIGEACAKQRPRRAEDEGQH